MAFLLAGFSLHPNVTSAAAAAASAAGRQTIAAGGLVTCAIEQDAKVACWGNLPTYRPKIAGPTEIPGLSGIVSIVAGQSHLCALDADGRVFCLGSAASGESGVPELVGGSIGARRVLGLPPVSALAADAASTCAVDRTGAAWCWGDNALGQAGSGDAVAFTGVPARVVGLEDVRAIDVGFRRACAAVGGDGAVWCWGVAQGGSDRYSPGASVATPQRVDGVTGAVSLAVGRRQTCALASDGSVRCWGLPGWETAPYPESPTVVPGLPPLTVIAVLTGNSPSLNDATCGTSSAGELWCWGGEYAAQLAGTFDASDVGGSGLAAVSLGAEHLCAVRADRTAWCLGLDYSGQSGGTGASATLVQVPQLVRPLALPSDDVAARVAYVPVAPTRLLETRRSGGQRGYSGARPSRGTIVTVPVAGQGGVPVDAAVVALNVTAVDAAAAGFVTVWPCGAPRPLASTLNVMPGATVANLVATGPGSGGAVCIYTQQAADLVVDLEGYAPAGTGIAAVAPARVLETRVPDGQIGYAGTRPGPASTVRFDVAGATGSPVPADGRTVFLNVTAVEPVGEGFLTVWGCDESRPTASTLNLHAGVTVANLVPVDLGGGQVCVYTSTGADIVADVTAWADAGPGVVPLRPVRIHDTRDPATAASRSVPAQTALSVPVPTYPDAFMPSDVAAVAVNVTSVDPRSDGFVTVWACDSPRPLASNVNVRAGRTTPNLVVTPLSADGHLCVYSNTSTDVVVDLTGYFG